MGNTLLQNDSRPQGKPRNMRPIMLRLLFALFLAVCAASAVAEPGRRQDRPDRQDGRQMSREDRQRMRDDVRDAYRNDRQDRQQQKTRQMSPEERGQLRRDIEDANRQMKR
jgi:hypothetical protein